MHWEFPRETRNSKIKSLFLEVENAKVKPFRRISNDRRQPARSLWWRRRYHRDPRTKFNLPHTGHCAGASIGYTGDSNNGCNATGNHSTNRDYAS